VLIGKSKASWVDVRGTKRKLGGRKKHKNLLCQGGVTDKFVKKKSEPKDMTTENGERLP